MSDQIKYEWKWCELHNYWDLRSGIDAMSHNEGFLERLPKGDIEFVPYCDTLSQSLINEIARKIKEIEGGEA